MTPELKRAIIKYIPEYFSWDETRQEEYRVQISEEIAFNIRRYLMAKLFGIVIANANEMKGAEHTMTDAQWSEINATMLPLQGIGDDYFYLNESFAEGKSALSFSTLHDYDFEDFQFQEECRKRDIKGYLPKFYQGSLYFTWARMLIDGTFSYANLTMLAGYINSEVDEFGNDYIAALIPYEFKPGKNHGKMEGDGYLHNMKQDAGGLEPQLEELTRRFWNRLQERLEQLQVEFTEESKQEVYIINTSREGEPNHQFIFTDKDILPRIGLKTFIADCRRAVQLDHSILFTMVEKEKLLMRQFLDKQHADIMRNFDAKIVRFKKKRKVIIHKDAGLDDLLD